MIDEVYKYISVVEHFSFKDKDDYIFMNVNTLDVYVLDEFENEIVNTLKDNSKNNGLDKLEKKYGSKIITDVVNLLMKNNILVAAGEKKASDTERTFRGNEDLTIINSIDILISEDCNLACKYCFVKNGKYHGKSAMMELDTGKKTVDFLIERSGRQKHLFINFFGGEPLINIEILKGIVIYAREVEGKNNKQFHFSITTNGTLLSNEIVKFFSQYRITVLVSIDGDIYSQNLNRPLSGGGDSYTIIEEGLKKLSDLNIYRSARATVSSITIDKIAENFEHLLLLGFRKIQFENALALKGKIFINTKEDIDKIKRQYSIISKQIIRKIQSGQSFPIETIPLPIESINTKRGKVFSCSAGRGYVSVDIKGDIYLCHRLVGERKFLMGNVVENTYDTSWTETIERELGVNNRKKCMSCWARYICGGGCYGINYEFNEDISLTPEVFCQLKKHTIKLALILYVNAVS